MGIVKTARDDLAADFAAFKAANPTATRAQRGKYLAAIADAACELLRSFNADDAAAAITFAASKQTQFDAYKATLADPTLAPVDPTT